MFQQSKYPTRSALTMLLMLPLSVMADEHGDKRMQQSDKPAMSQDMQSQQSQTHVDWKKMDEKLISADEVLSGDVTNGFNPVGNVRDLVLNPEGGAVEYILYDVPYPYGIYGATDGFVSFDNVALERSAGLNLNVRFDDEAAKGKEELRLTATEADHRLLSNLLDEPLVLSNDNTRKLEDVLIDRKSGDIAYYVVQMDEESLFNEDPRAIPADQVSVDADGSLEASISLDEIENMQAFAPDLLK